MGAGSLLQRLLGSPSEEPLLKQVRAGGAASLQRVVFTRNQRVMVSVGDGGKTLRLHESFREAPPEVLRAVGRLLSRTPAAERQAARETVHTFLASQLPAAPPAPKPRRRRIPAADRPVLARLQAEFDAVNHSYFGDSLPRVPLALSGRMRSRNGHFSSHPVEIVLSRRLCQEGVAGEAEKTLRHEMIHLWQHAEGRKPGHGRDFRRWAERLGIHPRATRAVEWKGAG